MKSLINRVDMICAESSCSSSKSMAAKAAAASTRKSEALAGKQVKIQHISAKDLSYFNSDSFKAILKRFDDSVLYEQYKDVIEPRKKAQRQDSSWRINDAIEIIMDDFYRKHDDGFRWDWPESQALLKGYRGIVLNKAKESYGFTQAIYFALAKKLEKKQAVRDFLKEMNAPIVRKHLQF